MLTCFYVGAGGFIGAILRYLASSVIYNEGFPLATFIVNFIGSMMIGAVIEVSVRTCAPPNLILFLKTGVCGGFTTFSTFSAEALKLFEKKQYLLGGGYAAGSVIACIAGVWVGKMLVAIILK